MKPKIVEITKRKLVGMKIITSPSENRTFELWSKFKPRVDEIKHRKDSDFYSIQIYDKDLKGNDISFTIVRFLSSKNLKKDEDAINSLTNEEVAEIERGVVNVKYQNISSLEGRLHEIFWELDLYKTTGDPNGHSLTQRFEFWKAAIGIIKKVTYK